MLNWGAALWEGNTIQTFVFPPILRLIKGLFEDSSESSSKKALVEKLHSAAKGLRPEVISTLVDLK